MRMCAHGEHLPEFRGTSGEVRPLQPGQIQKKWSVVESSHRNPDECVANAPELRIERRSRVSIECEASLLQQRTGDYSI